MMSSGGGHRPRPGPPYFQDSILKIKSDISDYLFVWSTLYLVFFCLTVVFTSVFVNGFFTKSIGIYWACVPAGFSSIGFSFSFWKARLIAKKMSKIDDLIMDEEATRKIIDS